MRIVLYVLATFLAIYGSIIYMIAETSGALRSYLETKGLIICLIAAIILVGTGFLTSKKSPKTHSKKQMFCKCCGKETPKKATVCLGCGMSPKDGNEHCSACGAETKNKQIICIACGVELNTSPLQRFLITFSWALGLFSLMIIITQPKEQWISCLFGVVIFSLLSGVITMAIKTNYKSIYVSVSVLATFTVCAVLGLIMKEVFTETFARITHQ